MIKKLSFSPKNRILQEMFSNHLTHMDWVDYMTDDIIVHHVTALDNDILQIEWETRLSDGTCRFGRQILNW